MSNDAAMAVLERQERSSELQAGGFVLPQRHVKENIGLLRKELKLSYHKKPCCLRYAHIMVTGFKFLNSNPICDLGIHWDTKGSVIWGSRGGTPHFWIFPYDHLGLILLIPC